MDKLKEIKYDTTLGFSDMNKDEEDKLKAKRKQLNRQIKELQDIIKDLAIQKRALEWKVYEIRNKLKGN